MHFCRRYLRCEQIWQTCFLKLRKFNFKSCNTCRNDVTLIYLPITHLARYFLNLYIYGEGIKKKKMRYREYIALYVWYKRKKRKKSAISKSSPYRVEHQEVCRVPLSQRDQNSHVPHAFPTTTSLQNTHQIDEQSTISRCT